jgi:hypothetical protein
MERKLTKKEKDLSIREHFAIQVLPMLIATSSEEDAEDVCRQAVEIADLLIKVLDENIR